MKINLDAVIGAALEEAKRLEAQAYRLESASWSESRPENRADAARFAQGVFDQARALRESAHQCTLGNY